MKIENRNKPDRRPLNCNTRIKTKINKGINRNNESRKSISELARIILSEAK